VNNKAYELLKEWMDDGGGYWYHDTSADVWYLNLRYAARSHSPNDAGFREDVKKLLADADAGRELREGSRDRDFFYKWLRPDLKRD
jgi:hypothetical protein